MSIGNTITAIRVKAGIYKSYMLKHGDKNKKKRVAYVA